MVASVAALLVLALLAGTGRGLRLNSEPHKIEDAGNASHRLPPVGVWQVSLTEGVTVQQPYNSSVTHYSMEDLLQARAGLPVYISASPGKVGRDRVSFFEKQCGEEGLHCEILHADYVSQDLANQRKSLAMFKLFNDSEHEVALGCEDDSQFTSNFRKELSQTARDLPKDWQVLHLCPGFFHGRQDTMPHYPQTFDFGMPEYPMAYELSANQRVFTEWPHAVGLQNPVNNPYDLRDGLWPGMPICYLMNKAGAKDLQEQFESLINVPIDVFLRNVAVDYQGRRKRPHYMAASPVLCVEAFNHASAVPVPVKDY